MNQVHPGPTEPVDRVPADATQACTGNTQAEQDAWFEGVEEGQRRTEHNAAVRGQTDGWKLVPIEPTPKMIKAWHDIYSTAVVKTGRSSRAYDALIKAAPTPPASAQNDAKDEHSDTYGMNLGERIAHVGGRTNAQGYTEFGSPMAVNALIQHVLRDIDWTRQDDDGAYQARYRLPGGQWSSWGHVVCGVKGHEQELRYLPGARRPAPTAGDARAALTKVESLQRYGFGYADDGNGARYLSSLKRDDGAFLRRDEVLAAIAAQQGEGGEA